MNFNMRTFIRKKQTNFRLLLPFYAGLPKGGTTKGCMISGKFGIVVKCGYAVFSCPFMAGGSNSPMQFHTMRMRWTL